MIFAAGPVQTPSDPTATYVIMGGACVFIAYVMMRVSARKKRDPMDRPFSSATLAQQRSTERHMENLLVEFSNMSREISAQLDTRAAKLEVLIADADERIARLKATILEAPARPRFEEPPPAMTVFPEPAPPPPAPPPAVIEEASPPSVDPRHAEIYRLANEGKSAHEIAAALDRHSGEVELILALRPH